MKTFVLLAIVSDRIMWKQVEKDGSFKIAEMSSRAGRSFVGLCSLLTEFEVRHTLLQFKSTVVIDITSN